MKTVHGISNRPKENILADTQVSTVFDTIEQMVRKRGDIEARRDKVIFYLIYVFGLPPWQMAELNVGDIWHSKGELTYSSMMRFNDGQPKVRHTIPFDDNERPAAMLAWYLRYVRPHLAGKPAGKERALFLSPIGHRMTVANLYWRFDLVLTRAGLSGHGYSLDSLLHAAIRRSNSLSLPRCHTLEPTTAGYVYYHED